MNPLFRTWSDTVAAQPDAPALVEAASERVWSRHELAAQAQRAAENLPSWISRRRVLLVCPNSRDWWTGFLALIERDAVVVPVDPSETPERQRQLASAVAAAAIWTGDGLQSLTPRSRRDRTTDLIKLTSGSTGVPRALRFRAEQLLADGTNVCRTMRIEPHDVNLAVIPFGHSYGLGNLVMPLLWQGTAIVLGRAPLPRVLAEDCARWRPTVFPAVPALLRLLAESDVEPDSLRSLRTIISAGSPLPAAIAHVFLRRFGRRIHSFYGSSETGGITYDRSGDATLAGRSVGTPLAGVSVTSSPGSRIWIESAAVYTLNNRHVTPAGHGRHRPADRVTCNDQGEWVLLGRTGRLVKIAARRLDLGEIEHALREVPGVTNSFVILHPERPEDLAAAVETTVDLADVRRRINAHLPAWKAPRRLLRFDRFPLTARGKVDTRSLVVALSRPISGPRPVPPTGGLDLDQQVPPANVGMQPDHPVLRREK